MRGRTILLSLLLIFAVIFGGCDTTGEENNGGNGGGTSTSTDTNNGTGNENETGETTPTVNSYEVIFEKNAENATGTMTPQEFEIGENQALTLNGFKYEEFGFLGWALGADEDVTYTNGQEISIDANVTLYAKWERIYEILPPGTDGTAGTNATYIYFGQYPQTVPAGMLMMSLDPVEVTFGEFTCMESLGDYWFKQEAKPAANNYTYSDGNAVTTGESKYFKMEPIKWRVLTINNGKKLLLAENILHGGMAFSGMREKYTYGGTEWYTNNWPDSRARGYLNGHTYHVPGKFGNIANAIVKSGFIGSAFNELQKAAIVSTTVSNDLASAGYEEDNTAMAKYVCDATTDKIFLLSISELIDYGFKAQTEIDATRARKATDFAIATGVSIDNDTKYGDWFLRSFADQVVLLGHDPTGVYYVGKNGKANNVLTPTNTTAGFVPALWLE